MGVSLGLVVDRTRITGVELSHQQYLIARVQLPEIVALQKHFLAGTDAKISYHPEPEKYRYAINLSFGANQSIARLEVGSTPTLHFYLAWELWPHRLNCSEFRAFHCAVETLLDLPVFSYPFAFQHGRVQKMELASDSITTKMHSFILWSKYSRSSRIFLNATGKGSNYLGSEDSPKYFIAYDKHRELIEKKLQSNYHTHTRIEAKLNKTGISPVDLIGLANPFESLCIADKTTARNLTTNTQWQKFLDIAEVKGSAAALAALPKKCRTEMRANLRLSAATWWNPDFIWSGFPRAIESIHPYTVLKV
jgi:hypothetical protein